MAQRFKALLFVSALMSVNSAAANTAESSVTFAEKLTDAAKERTQDFVIYNGSYFAIPYPNGDVPSHFGVCTDVVVRSYRALGIDLQKLVHEDMSTHFNHYPSKRIWGLKKADRNIDHRRVPNLQTFFSRYGQSLEISHEQNNYHAGDLVTWRLANNRPHIGIVSDQKNENGRPMIIHNIGAGPKQDDVLFAYEITGHYRYQPKNK